MKHIKPYVVILFFFVFSTACVAQKNRSASLKPGFYFFGQTVSEWVGGGYYLLKQDSTFIFFSPLWQSVIDCDAMDVNPNYFGEGRWMISKTNELILSFGKTTYDYLRLRSEVIYNVKNYISRDSVYIQCKVSDSINSWFLEIQLDTIGNKKKIVKPVSNSQNLSISVPVTYRPISLNVSSIGYYSQKIELLQGFNFHNIEIKVLQKKGQECFRYIEPIVISEKVVSGDKGKVLFGRLLKINRIDDKEEVISNLKMAINKYPELSIVMKNIIQELEKVK
ncbi:hypothetical protein [Lacibacter sp. H407]|uniref:hypothetical protein n=1 Tax=Lacibacter sp. H407 TaxID=3133423 RepID=UPI0030C0764E